jgi:hypothetical protein
MTNYTEFVTNELMGNFAQKLIVNSGEMLSIFPRTYQFESITIEKGASLVVYPNLRQWLLLMCSGDFVLDGNFTYETFLRTEDEITAVAPDGVMLTHKFVNLSKSGDGGNGGSYKAAGGHGASGSPEYGGGGGGSGAYRYGDQYRPGQNADGIFGAKATGAGGDGGAFSRFCNGGLVYLSVQGRLLGNGAIRVSGTNGNDGNDGEQGWSRPGGYGVGGGGGGGGAAGGDGGRIVIKASVIEGMPDYIAAFGKGGRGGNANAGGNSGRPGQDGISGSIDQI